MLNTCTTINFKTCFYGKGGKFDLKIIALRFSSALFPISSTTFAEQRVLFLTISRSTLDGKHESQAVQCKCGLWLVLPPARGWPTAAVMGSPGGLRLWHTTGGLGRSLHPVIRRTVVSSYTEISGFGVQYSSFYVSNFFAFRQ